MAKRCELDDYPGYSVTDDGFVWSLWYRINDPQTGRFQQLLGKKWKKLESWSGPWDHQYVSVRRSDGKHITRSVHDLVIRTFIGPPKEGQECRHLDGDGSNNRITNLRWGTSIENKADMKLHGTAPQGTNNGNAKIDDDIVKWIRAMYKQGMRNKDIAACVGLSKGRVSDIGNGKGWWHV